MAERFFRPPDSAFGAILPDLAAFVREFPWDFPRQSCGEDVGHRLSEDHRAQLADIPFSIDRRIIALPFDMTASLSKTIADLFGAEPSGAVLYPPHGWMGWHTNSDRDGWRLYISYSRSTKSFFRWKDGDAVVTDYDKEGFNFRYFRIGSKDDPFWHCVYADDWRFSLGFRFG